MSSRLSNEIAGLATEARHMCIRDHETIEKLTLVVGYGHLVESHPNCWQMLRKHIQAFMDLICHQGQPELYRRSEKILEITGDFQHRDAA